MNPALAASWMPTVDEGYQRMLAAIAAATTDLRLEMYIYRPGDPGDRFRDALVAAARRGVRVRVLLDGLGSNGLPPDYWAGLRAAGGEAAFFNPLALHRIAIRDHRKLLVADERLAFLGGFNIAPEYEGDGVTRGWRDLGVALEGAAARCLAASFDVMWKHREFRHPLGLRLRGSRFLRMLRGCGSSEVIATGPGWGWNAFHRSLLGCLRGAREVQLATAYFLPSHRLRRALAQVVRRGGRVRLLLAGHTDVPLAQTAGRVFFGGLLGAGLEIAEYQPQIFHAKLALVDDVAFAGSSNLDVRSLGINYEIMVRVADPAFAAQGRALFEADWARSRPIRRAEWRRARTLADQWVGWAARFLLTKVDPWLARRQLRRLS